MSSDEGVEKVVKSLNRLGAKFFGDEFFYKILTVHSKPLMFANIWQNLVEWPLCLKPGNDGKS